MYKFHLSASSFDGDSAVPFAIHRVSRSASRQHDTLSNALLPEQIRAFAKRLPRSLSEDQLDALLRAALAVLDTGTESLLNEPVSLRATTAARIRSDALAIIAATPST